MKITITKDERISVRNEEIREHHIIISFSRNNNEPQILKSLVKHELLELRDELNKLNI